MDSMGADRPQPNPSDRRSSRETMSGGLFADTVSQTSFELANRVSGSGVSRLIPADALTVAQRQLAERCIARLTDLSDQKRSILSLINRLQVAKRPLTGQAGTSLISWTRQLLAKVILLSQSIKRLELEMAGGVPEPTTHRAPSDFPSETAPVLGYEESLGLRASLESLRSSVAAFSAEINSPRPNTDMMAMALNDVNRQSLEMGARFYGLNRALQFLVIDHNSEKNLNPPEQPSEISESFYANRGRLEGLASIGTGLCSGLLGRMVSATQNGGHLAYCYMEDLVTSLCQLVTPGNGPLGVENRRATDAHIRQQRIMERTKKQDRTELEESEVHCRRAMVREFMERAESSRHAIRESLIHRLPDIHDDSDSSSIEVLDPPFAESDVEILDHSADSSDIEILNRLPGRDEDGIVIINPSSDGDLRR